MNFKEYQRRLLQLEGKHMTADTVEWSQMYKQLADALSFT